MRIIEKFTDVFVETGTFVGDGIQVAINAGYKKIISIEIEKKFVDMGKLRFSKYPQVNLVLGDSALILGDVIKDINEPITFWLDGHNSGKDTGFGIKCYPLLEELDQIKLHPLKNHTIMIDDVRLWKQFDNELNLDNIVKKILDINPKYSFYTIDGHLVDGKILPDDILIAKIDEISLPN